jgi:hypothetical protein
MTVFPVGVDARVPTEYARSVPADQREAGTSETTAGSWGAGASLVGITARHDAVLRIGSRGACRSALSRDQIAQHYPVDVIPTGR